MKYTLSRARARSFSSSLSPSCSFSLSLAVSHSHIDLNNPPPPVRSRGGVLSMNMWKRDSERERESARARESRRGVLFWVSLCRASFFNQRGSPCSRLFEALLVPCRALKRREQGDPLWLKKNHPPLGWCFALPPVYSLNMWKRDSDICISYMYMMYIHEYNKRVCTDR